MAVIHKGVDKIIDSNNKEVIISTAADTIAAVNDASTGLNSKASTTDLTTGLGTKLDSTAQAADSAKLGTYAPSHFATATDLTNGLASKANQADVTTGLNGKLGVNTSTGDVAITGMLDVAIQAFINGVPVATQPSGLTPAGQALSWDGMAFQNVEAGVKPASVTPAGQALSWDGSAFQNVQAGTDPKITFAVEGSDNVWTFDPS